MSVHDKPWRPQAREILEHLEEEEYKNLMVIRKPNIITGICFIIIIGCIAMFGSLVGESNKHAEIQKNLANGIKTCGEHSAEARLEIDVNGSIIWRCMIPSNYTGD